ncbi:MAG TPA: Maf family protein [Gemmatimonadales bacterium]
MDMHPIVLASQSPRRRQLLEMLGLTVIVSPTQVQEVRLPRETPSAYAGRLARDKARAVPGALVLGADTIVVIDGEVLEKPVDADDALRMLRRLQGRRHEVITSVCLLADGDSYEAQDATVVQFLPADDATLRAYIATGEPLDKAGAYGIQGYGAALVERVEGDFFGVMGLPLRLVLELLARAGKPYRFPVEEGRGGSKRVEEGSS